MGNPDLLGTRLEQGGTLASAVSLFWLLLGQSPKSGVRVPNASPCQAALLNCMDGSAAREHRVSKNIGRESQIGSTVGFFLR